MNTTRLITISASTIIAVMAMWNNAAFGEDLQLRSGIASQPAKPSPDQIDGLRSVRKIKLAGQRHVYYDYLLMDGTVWSTESPLIGDEKPRDLRPWEQRSLKNKLAFNTWNFGLRPLAEMATPAVVALLRR